MKRQTPAAEAQAGGIFDDLLSRLTDVQPAKEYSDAAEFSIGGRKPPFIGYCFGMSFDFLFWLIGRDANRDHKASERRGTWLVHGRCLLAGVHEHGWVELPGGICYDAVYLRFVSRRSYYRVLLAQPFHKYTPQAALHIVAHLMRSNPEVCDPNCPYQDPWHFVLWHRSRCNSRMRYYWFPTFPFPMNPSKPVLIDVRKVNALIEAK